MSELKFSRASVEVGNHPTSYWRLRPPDEGAPRVLLLHGLGASSHIWEALAPRLHSTFDLIALDFPGAGGTPSLGPLNPTALAAFAGRFLQSLQIEHVHVVVGHSLGGTVALELALSQAPRLGGLMLLNAAPKLPLPAQLALANPLVRRLSPLLRTNMSSPLLVRAYLSMIFGDASKVTPEIVAGYAQLAEAPDYSFRMSEQMDGLAQHRRRRSELRAVTAPTSVVWGDKDPLFGRRFGERLASDIPRATLHRLPRVGHCPAQEAPEVVADLVRELLMRVGRRSAA